MEDSEVSKRKTLRQTESEEERQKSMDRDFQNDEDTIMMSSGLNSPCFSLSFLFRASEASRVSIATTGK